MLDPGLVIQLSKYMFDYWQVYVEFHGRRIVALLLLVMIWFLLFMFPPIKI